MHGHAVHASEAQGAGDTAAKLVHKHMRFSHTELGTVHSMPWGPAGSARLLFCLVTSRIKVDYYAAKKTQRCMINTPPAVDLHQSFQSGTEARRAAPGLVWAAALCMTCSEMELVGG